MTQQNQKHTAKSLQEMFNRNPRELDALAHEVVFGERPLWIEKRDDISIPFVFSPPDARGYIDRIEVPKHSTSLDAAALLEAELIKRGMEYHYLESMGDAYYETEGKNMPPSQMVTADAKTRTIAAILTITTSQA